MKFGLKFFANVAKGVVWCGVAKYINEFNTSGTFIKIVFKTSDTQN